MTTLIRNGPNARFYSPNREMGFMLCRYKERLSSYDDPFLKEMEGRAEKIGVKGFTYWSVYDQSLRRYEVWLGFNGGEKILRADPVGWIIRPPSDPAKLTAFSGVCETHHLEPRNEEWVLVVSQDGLCDPADRIDLGVKLLGDLFALYS